MEKVLLYIFTASALCAAASLAARQYYFIYEPKTWADAQSYCREKYTDLVTVDSLDVATILNNMVNLNQMGNETDAWIGLYEDIQSWRWSLVDDTFYQGYWSQYRNWISGQPDNSGSNEPCSEMFDGGQWNDLSCEATRKPLCVSVNVQAAKFVAVNSLMTWSQAQSHCRTYYTDLASVRSSTENSEVLAAKPIGESYWLGLYRDTWKWSDGDRDAFSYWTSTQPGGSTEHCTTAYFSDSGRWRDWLCSYAKPFICHYALWAVSTLAKIQYHFNYEPKSWSNAQSFCRKTYTDLVTVDSTEIMTILRNKTGSTTDRKMEPEAKEKRTDVSKLEEALSNVQLSEELLPESYRSNSPKEQQLLNIADNFQRQYLLLCPDRKPLLLCPVNECGVRKFVSTTLRPTETGLCELQSWQDCASLVADFLSLRPLEPPTEVPSQMLSSTSVLRSQKATCFESATLLCSLLLGFNYDAYCVSGYASKEMCLLDLSLQQCPLLDTKVKAGLSEASEQKEQKEQKYAVRCQGELRSCFLIEQEKKKQEAEATLLLEKELQEEKNQSLADPLRGFRVHSWVLVLSGRRNIEENFFIDPLTGCSFPTNDDNFQGIESLWNTFNYYINRQDCSNGCRDMLFDLDNSSRWEKLLHDGINQWQLVQAVQRRQENRIIGKITSDVEVIHPSIRLSIVFSQKDLETRFPGGKKITRYRKAKLERFSLTVTKDGLISRLTTYQDLECTQVTGVKEWFRNRSDGLEQRDFNKLENSTAERFKLGRDFNLLFHAWKPVASGIEREMRFNCPEQDGLERRVTSPEVMEESFTGRDDFLYFRHVDFNQGGQPPSLYALEISPESLNVRKVVECFHRNPSKPVNEDVAQRVLLVPELQIKLTYHLMDHRTIPSKKTIRNPKDGKPLMANMFSAFQVDQSEKPPGPLSWYRMMESLRNEEEKMALQIKASLMEVENILDCREREQKELVVFSSPLEEVIACREKWEEELTNKEELLIFHRHGMEVMVPFLARLGNSEYLSSKEASSLSLGCSAAFKEKLVEYTSFLQSNLEMVIEVQEEENNSQNHQHDPTMTKEEAELTCHLCWDKKFYISAAQRRLQRHKEKLESRCQDFLLKLHQNPLLASHFNS
ncbi:dynein regulatory complex subunit 7 [Anableps anableps]